MGLESDVAGMDSDRNEERPGYVFIPFTTPKTKNPETQRIVRQHVMRDIGKNRRSSTRIRPRKPVQYNLQLRYVETAADPLFHTSPLSTLVHHHAGMQDQWPHQVKATTSTDSNSAIAKQGPCDTIAVVRRVRNQEGPHLWIDEVSQSTLPEALKKTAISRFGAGRNDPFIKYPIEINPRTHALIDHIFDNRFGYLKPYRNAWFPVALTGAAAFHQVLSNLALHVRLERPVKFASENYETQESIVHHSIALKLVNEQILNPSAESSDDTLGAVLGMACFAHVIDDFDAWNAHIAGLQELLRLRGGSEGLRGGLLMLRLAMFWTDLMGSCTQDIVPHFPLPTAYIPLLPPLSPDPPLPLGALNLSKTWRFLLPHRFDIIDIFDDLCRVTYHIKEEAYLSGGEVYKDFEFSGTFLNPLLYRLLAARTDVQNDNDAVFQEALRLASILYLAEVRRTFGIFPVWSRAHVKKLKRVLENQVDWKKLTRLKLWVLAMGAMEAETVSDKAWFQERLQNTFKSEGFACYTEAERYLQTVAWIDEIHGHRYKMRWLEQGSTL